MKKAFLFSFLIFIVFFISSCLTTGNINSKVPGVFIGKFTIKIVNQWHEIKPGTVFTNMTLHIKRGPLSDIIDVQTNLRKGKIYLKNLIPGVYEIESFSFENVESRIHSVSYYYFEKVPLNIKFLVFEKTITVIDSAEINIEVISKKQSRYKIIWIDEKESLKKEFIENNKKYKNYDWNEMDFKNGMVK